jgi:Tfp pilus assembly protein PilV
MDKKLKNIAGVSLIEITVGMLLVAIALFTIASIFPKMGAQSKGITEAEQARIIGMEVLEGLQRLAAGTPSGIATSGVCTGAAAFGGAGAAAVPNYDSFRAKYITPQVRGGTSYTVTLPPAVSCNSDGIKTATLTVNWKKSGKNRNITVTGVIK